MLSQNAYAKYATQTYRNVNRRFQGGRINVLHVIKNRNQPMEKNRAPTSPLPHLLSPPAQAGPGSAGPLHPLSFGAPRGASLLPPEGRCSPDPLAPLLLLKHPPVHAVTSLVNPALAS